MTDINIRTFRDIIRFYKSQIFLLSIIVIAVVLAYHNVLSGEFLSADDLQGIVRNEELKNLPSTLKSLHLDLITRSLILNIFGPNSTAFHILSLVLHTINCFLVFLLAYLFVGKKYAFFSALLFAVLPTASETVFWISAVGYLFQAMLTFICLIIFLLFVRTRQRRYLYITVLVYLFATLTLRTPWLLTIPFLIFVVDLFPFIQQNKNEKLHITLQWVKEKSYYLLFLAASMPYVVFFLIGASVTRVNFINNAFYTGGGDKTPYIQRTSYTIFKTVELYTIPVQLTFYHEEPLPDQIKLMEISSILFIAITCFATFRTRRYAGFFLAIISSILPTFSPVQVGWFIAERYLYVGSTFFVMLLSVLIVNLPQVIKSSVPSIDKYRIIASLTVITIVATLYMLKDYVRSDVFKSNKNFWWAVRFEAPYSFRAINNLGSVYFNEGDYILAYYYFNKVIQQAPDYPGGYYNLAYMYYALGNYGKAKNYYLSAFSKSPGLYQALEKLAEIETKEGNSLKAAEYSYQALKIKEDGYSK